ncbi:MAG: uridine kinase [Phycisphaerales bacterium JB040]
MSERGPILVGWDDAVEAVLRLVRARESRGIPVVGVTGRVSAGKSTLARRIASSGGGLVHTTDDYLPDYEGLPIEDVDLPEHSHLEELAGHLVALQRGEAVEVPEWSFHAHARVGTKVIGPAERLVVLEGIHALHETVAGHLDVRVFVEAGEHVRWSRRVAIEESGERGWGVEKARDHFDRVAEPTFARFEAAYLAVADVVVVNE